MCHNLCACLRPCVCTWQHPPTPVPILPPSLTQPPPSCGVIFRTKLTIKKSGCVINLRNRYALERHEKKIILNRPPPVIAEAREKRGEIGLSMVLMRRTHRHMLTPGSYPFPSQAPRAGSATLLRWARAVQQPCLPTSSSGRTTTPVRFVTRLPRRSGAKGRSARSPNPRHRDLTDEGKRGVQHCNLEARHPLYCVRNRRLDGGSGPAWEASRHVGGLTVELNVGWGRSPRRRDG